MGLFTKDKKFKFKKIPSTPEQTSARSYLNNLYQQPLEFPTEQIADLSATEKQIQGQLPDYLANNQKDYGAARSYLNDILSGSYDPRTSDYYKGLRQEQEQLKSGAQLNVRRGAQKAGMARSTPSQGIQADVGQNYDTQTLQQLGALYENERGRMGAAATALPGVNAQFLSNVGNAENIAAVERQQQQMKFSAMFNAAMNTLLAPYNYNAKIASTLLNEQRYVGVETGGGVTDLGFAAQLSASMFGAYAVGGGFAPTARAGAGAGAGAMGGYSTATSPNFWNQPLSAYPG